MIALTSTACKLAKSAAILVMALAPTIGAVSAFAQGRNFAPTTEVQDNLLPKQAENVGITENLGKKVDLNLKFKNEAGELVPLSTYFQPGKPVLLSLAYYNCPNLCNFHLNGMKDALRRMNWTTGTEFQYVVVSIDAKETPSLAAAKKETYLKAYGRDGAGKGWHFLVGDEASIRALADQVGFGFKWDEQEKQWAHAAAAQVLTPGGEISRYLYGIVFDPQTLRLSLVEASNGLVGNIVDKLILYCFHYDPKASKYTLYAFNVMRAGGILIVLVLAAFLLPFWLRQRKEAGNLQGEV